MTKLEALNDQFCRALQRLKEVLNVPETDITRDSAIQRFEFTLDLAWKTLKAYLEDKKGIICNSPKECFKEAYRQKLIDYDVTWLKLVDMRNLTAHIYNENTAIEVFNALPEAVKYFDLLLNNLQL